MKVKLTKEQQEFLASGTMVNTRENIYLYMPYWFRSLPNNEFELLTFDYLPEDLKEHLESLRK